jgi:ABC-2 type transport system ATP-binding protein
MLELVELRDAADRRVGGFSKGMRQRVKLAQALVHSPELLLLDEPLNGLDPEGVRWIRGLIRSQAAAGRTVLVSSHLIGEMAQTADRVIVIDRGRLLADTSLDQLTALGGGSLEDAFFGLTEGSHHGS